MFDRKRLTIGTLGSRKSKTELYPLEYRPIPDPKTTWAVLGDANQTQFLELLASDIANKQKVILGFGAHFIKNKCHQYLMDITDTGFFRHIVTNGASTIHDFEFAYYLRTEEDVRENLANGTFGLWETGEHLNKAINLYGHLGYGKAIGRWLSTIDIKNQKHSSFIPRHHSLSYHCYEKEIPFSICTSIGHDIIYEHPECNGAKIGHASYVDFLNLAETLEGLEDAVILSVGSAITFPMVMEKAYAMAKNVNPKTGNNCSCYVIDLMDGSSGWQEGEPSKNDPNYYNRPMKTFNRMFPKACQYAQMDNRVLMYHLKELIQKRVKWKQSGAKND